jgi:hypothetical protein
VASFHAYVSISRFSRTVNKFASATYTFLHLDVMLLLNFALLLLSGCVYAQFSFFDMFGQQQQQQQQQQRPSGASQWASHADSG